MATIALKVSDSSTGTGPREIVLNVDKHSAPPFGIGLVTITEDTGLSAIDGAITPGPGISGEADISLPPSLFTPLWNFLPGNKNPHVDIDYDVGSLPGGPAGIPVQAVSLNV